MLYYIATKLEAVRSRGGEDLRFSHDFEDIVYVLNYSSEVRNILRRFADALNLKKTTLLTLSLVVGRGGMSAEEFLSMDPTDLFKVNRSI